MGFIKLSHLVELVFLPQLFALQVYNVFPFSIFTLYEKIFC